MYLCPKNIKKTQKLHTDMSNFSQFVNVIPWKTHKNKEKVKLQYYKKSITYILQFYCL